MDPVAIVTGIRRVGYEIAKDLLSKGFNLTVVYRSSKDKVKELQRLAEKKGRKVLALKIDLRDEDPQGIVDETLKTFSRVDALIHLASPYYRTPLSNISKEAFYDHFKPIAEAFYFMALAFYRASMKNEGPIKGRIVAFGDWAVEKTPYRGYSSYFIAKGALHSAVKVLAKEFAPDVLVNCIALGPTLKAEDLSEEEWQKILRNTPLKRPVSLRDVLDLTMFLLRTESMTGEILFLDSGRHIAGSGVGSVG